MEEKMDERITATNMVENYRRLSNSLSIKQCKLLAKNDCDEDISELSYDDWKDRNEIDRLEQIKKEIESL